MASAVETDVWNGQDVAPAQIEAALRDLLLHQAQHDNHTAPARVLNLVVVVDREWKGEIANRLERVGRYHPSRTIMCAVEPRRDAIDAWATLNCDDSGSGMAGCREQVEIDLGERHLAHLDTVVDPVLVSEVQTVVWAPHGHTEAMDSLLHLADCVLVDSVTEDDPVEALQRVGHLSKYAHVVDLAWLRSTPWRERIASAFDPPAWREMLGSISRVTVRQQPDSTAAALLLLGWLCSRLGWRPERLVPSGDARRGRAKARKTDVVLCTEVDTTMPVPGLAGVTLETASGQSLSLDRGPGGLVAHRRNRDGTEREWTALGASRGEGGILGEGVRQALLRDPTYRPALEAARAML